MSRIIRNTEAFMAETFPQGYALLVGVGHAAYAPWSLPVTVKDARAIRAVLVDSSFCAYPDDGRHVHLLHDEQATRDAILEGLDWLAREVITEPHSTAIVYFSGHGWLEESTGRYFLIPHDVVPHDIPGSAILAEAFIEALRQVKAERLLAIVDACHAEGMATAKGNPAGLKPPAGLVPASLPKAVVEELKQGAGRAVFTSSRGHQSSWVRPDGTMSVYTYHLIEALQGANNRSGETAVKLSNLMNHLGRSVPEFARILCNAEQVPFFDTASEDFAVALLRGGKGLPGAGWTAVEEDSRAAIGRIVQAIGERSIAVGGDVSGSVFVAGDGNQVSYGPTREVLGFEGRVSGPKKASRVSSKGMATSHPDAGSGAEGNLPCVYPVCGTGRTAAMPIRPIRQRGIRPTARKRAQSITADAWSRSTDRIGSARLARHGGGDG
jgi:Caspase domain